MLLARNCKDGWESKLWHEYQTENCQRVITLNSSTIQDCLYNLVIPQSHHWYRRQYHCKMMLKIDEYREISSLLANLSQIVRCCICGVLTFQNSCAVWFLVSGLCSFSHVSSRPVGAEKRPLDSAHQGF